MKTIMATIMAITAACILLVPPAATAQTFICTSNPDYFSKRCTIHPNAITKVTDGRVEKGHLVGCQSKSYSCLNVGGKYQCADNFGSAKVPFDFAMTDLNRFCSLLCNNPACAGRWE